MHLGVEPATHKKIKKICKSNNILPTFAAPIFREKEMDKFKAYKLNFSGLKIGEHSFDFQLDEEFFSAFEGGSILAADLPVHMRLLKTENGMQLHFSGKGTVQVLCDRCLEAFTLPLDFEEVLHIRFGQHTHEQAEDVLVLSHEATHLALAQYLYEYAELNLPMRKVHPEDVDGNSVCNPGMLKHIESSETKEEEIDPRWDALKQLIEK